jgi:hypothetical protein
MLIARQLLNALFEANSRAGKLNCGATSRSCGQRLRSRGLSRRSLITIRLLLNRLGLRSLGLRSLVRRVRLLLNRLGLRSLVRRVRLLLKGSNDERSGSRRSEGELVSVTIGLQWHKQTKAKRDSDQRKGKQLNEAKTYTTDGVRKPVLEAVASADLKSIFKLLRRQFGHLDVDAQLLCGKGEKETKKKKGNSGQSRFCETSD